MADFSAIAPASQTRVLPRPVVENGRSGTIGAALGRLTTLLEERADGQWRFRLPGMRRSARAKLSAEWLCLSVSLRTLQKPMDVRLIGATLRRNARIDGSPRIIGFRERRRRELVVDIPTDLLPWQSESEIERMLAASISSLGAALNSKPAFAAMPRQAHLPREELEAIFDEAGWPTRYGEDDGLQVPLDVLGSYLTATVKHDGSSTALSVSILENQPSSVPDACRGAVAVLLWLVASRVRLVKPTRSKRALALDVTLGAVTAAELAHGCAALSTALQQLVDEAKLLIANEHLAQVYLSNLGFETAA